MSNEILNTSGQHFLYAQEYRVNRPDPDSTTGDREDVDVTPLLSAFNAVTLDIDATEATVSPAFTLPAGALVVLSTLNVTEDFVGGTTVEIGLNADPDSLFSVTTPTTGAIVSTGASVNAIAGGDYDVTVTGTYTTGAAVLKVVYLDTRKTTDDPPPPSDSSQVTLGLEDSLPTSGDAP